MTKKAHEASSCSKEGILTTSALSSNNDHDARHNAKMSSNSQNPMNHHLLLPKLRYDPPPHLPATALDRLPRTLTPITQPAIVKRLLDQRHFPPVSL